MLEPNSLSDDLNRLSSYPRGKVGVTVHHIETGQRYSVNPQVLFPLASTCKLPIAVCLLSLVDGHKIDLKQSISIKDADHCPFSGILSSPGTDSTSPLALEKLLDLMLTVSDNTASDLLLNQVGGPQAVSAYLEDIGLDGMRLYRSLKDVISDLFGLAGPSIDNGWAHDRFISQVSNLTDEDQLVAVDAFLEDPHDCTTSGAMVDLIVKAYGRGLLSDASRNLLFDLLQRCEIPDSGLPNMLPAETAVAHKPGEMRRVTVSDVGLVSLPEDSGHFAIAVYVKSHGRGEYLKVSESRDVIGCITRAVYDHFCGRD